MDRRHSLAALGTLGLVAARSAAATEPGPPLRPGPYIVSPQGPKDGGDFGPLTPNTQTSGLQEAFDACKRDKRDLVIVGGGAPAPFENPGGVYALQKTLEIPWMQDFRCDGGESVIQYMPHTGDAILIDSQMSCFYKFGLVALMQGGSNGACVRIRPRSAGPDRLIAFVTNRIELNALVAGGSRGLETGSFVTSGDGLVLDSTLGAINGNRFHIHEILGADRGVYLTSPGPHLGVLNNHIDCTFAHICKTHFQLGDNQPEAGVLWNHIDTLVDGQNLDDTTGLRFFGRGNTARVTLLSASPTQGIVFEPTARENLVLAANLLGRYTDRAMHPSNRIQTLEPDGLRLQTPPIPASDAWIENPCPSRIEVLILTPGAVQSWEKTSSIEPPILIQGSLWAGQSIYLDPHERVRFRYTEPFSWHWRPIA